MEITCTSHVFKKSFVNEMLLKSTCNFVIRIIATLMMYCHFTFEMLPHLSKL